MSKLARDAISGEKLTVLADRGYFDGEEIRQCAEDGITTLVPKPLTSNSRADGRFDKRDFIYVAKRDEYRCPAGEKAPLVPSRVVARHVKVTPPTKTRKSTWYSIYLTKVAKYRDNWQVFGRPGLPANVTRIAHRRSGDAA